MGVARPAREARAPEPPGRRASDPEAGRRRAHVLRPAGRPRRRRLAPPASADPSGLVLLTGTTTPPPPGGPWESTRVVDGLRVLGRYAAFVGEDGARARFAPVEVRVGDWSRPEGRPVVEIVTRAGLSVVWGVDLPDGSASVAGPSAEEKLACLAATLPRLARRARRPVAYVSVRHRSGAVLGFRDDAGRARRDGAR